MSIFKTPSYSNIHKRSSKVTGYPPTMPDLGSKEGMKTGHPSAKNTYKIKKPK